MVRDQQRFLDIVGDEQHGSQALFGLDHLFEQLLHRQPGLRVQRRERLVHQQHLALGHQQPGQCGARLHATRHLVRVQVAGIAQPDAGQVMHHLGLDLVGAVWATQAMAVAAGESDVVEHRQPGQQRRALEHETAVWPGLSHVSAVDHHAAGGRMGESGDHVEDRRLAAAGGSDHRRRLSGLDAQRHLVEREPARIVAAEGFGCADQLDLCAHDLCARFLPAHRPTQCSSRRSTARNSKSMVTPTNPINATPT